MLTPPRKHERYECDQFGSNIRFKRMRVSSHSSRASRDLLNTSTRSESVQDKRRLRPKSILKRPDKLESSFEV